MFDLNLFIALVSFYFVMYVTPGPNNAMVLTSGLKFGFLKTIPHMSGITIGHILQLILVCLGLGKIFQLFPEIQNLLKIICAIYLLYLGYKIIGSFSKIKAFEQCPKQFYHMKILKEYEEKETEAMLYGTLFHEAAEEYVKNQVPLPLKFDYALKALDRLQAKQGRKLCEYKLGLTKELEPCMCPEWMTEWYIKLSEIMKSIHAQCVKYGQNGNKIDYIKGANIGGFIKVANAMLDQGCV